jgi:hypothetical protein
MKGAAVALNTPTGRSAELDALFAYTGQTPGKRDKRTSMIYLLINAVYVSRSTTEGIFRHFRSC